MHQAVTCRTEPARLLYGLCLSCVELDGPRVDVMGLGDAFVLSADGAWTPWGRDRRQAVPRLRRSRGWSLNLMHLTRDELCDLVGRIEGARSCFAPVTTDRLNALTSLGNIRRVMVSRDLHY